MLGKETPVKPGSLSADALALRKATHKTLAMVDSNIDQLGFNRSIAQIYQLVNVIAADAKRDKLAKDTSLAYVLDESMTLLLLMFAPMMPHLAEECWAALGREDLVANQPWPTTDQAMLVEEEITLPIQINGKKAGGIDYCR